MTSDRRDFLTAASAAGALTLGPAMARAESDTVTVHTPAGILRGRKGDGIDVFTGVSYGLSTAGAARFQPPRPVPTFTEIFDATKPATVPPQTVSQLMPAPGAQSEDCLQLNIWAPRSPGPHPVFVWIYGGGNVSGACGMPIYDAASFARDGIVAININYRVGALGFLELGGVYGPQARGGSNNAMRDQLLALHWVQRNVAAFGGDPERVTVGGESGGAFNTVCLLGSPASKGLFRRAIVASGGQSVQDSDGADAFARIYVEQLGGADRLHTASPVEIVAAQSKAAALWPLAAPFRQMIGPGLLPLAPIAAIGKGSAQGVDLMIGVTRDETRLLVPPALAATPNPKLQMSTLLSEQLEPLYAAYAKAYPQLSQAELTWKITTAEAFAVPSMRIADAQASIGARVYRYLLDYPIAAGPFGGMSPHGIDLPLAFEQFDSPIAHVFGFSAVDLPMAKTVHGAWEAFIKSGTPEVGDTSWPTYDAVTQKTMVLSRTPTVVASIDKVDRAIWEGTL